MKKIMVKMVNLLAKKQSGAINIRLFEEDIAELRRVHPDLEEHYDEKTGKLTVNKGTTGSIIYDYEIVSGSTYAVDQKTQQENLVTMMQTLIQNPQVLELLGQDYEIKFGELFKRIISNSGIQDWDKILVERTEEEKADFVLQQHAQEFMQAAQQAGNMNQIPPEQAAPPPGPQL
jgi:hypothetical protein